MSWISVTADTRLVTPRSVWGAVLCNLRFSTPLFPHSRFSEVFLRADWGVRAAFLHQLPCCSNILKPLSLPRVVPYVEPLDHEVVVLLLSALRHSAQCVRIVRFASNKGKLSIKMEYEFPTVIDSEQYHIRQRRLGSRKQQTTVVSSSTQEGNFCIQNTMPNSTPGPYAKCNGSEDGGIITYLPDSGTGF